MSTTADYPSAQVFKRRNRIAAQLKEVLQRNKPHDNRDFNAMSSWEGDQRADWYWDRVADELAELIDRGKLY